jgi:hypothetical protein
MNSFPIVLVLAAGLSFADLGGYAQSTPPAKPDTAKPASTASAPASSTRPETTEREGNTADLPVVKIELNDPAPVPGVPELHGYINPLICSPEGIPFVTVPNLSDFRKNTVYSLDAKGGHAFAANAIPDLYDIHTQGYFVGDSMVGLLVRATRDDKKAAKKITVIPGSPPWDVYVGAHHEFLLEFDRSGNYKKTVDLPTAYHFWRVAELADDSLLALAYDGVNSIVRLLLLDSGGQIVRPLEVPAKMADSPDLRRGESGEDIVRMQAESAMSWWLFAPARHKILLYQARSKSPVLEVGAGGVVREVPLEAPRGYTLANVISASDRWIMRYRRDGLSDFGEVDTRPESKNFVLYEVNPSDGTLKNQIDLEGTRHFDIACEQDGALIGFSMEGEKVLRLTADLPR